MREIKFKAWDSHLKVMHYNIQTLDSFNEFLSRDRYKIIQYTGLKDSENIEIYEGDYLEGVSANIFSIGNIEKYKITWGIDHWHVENTDFFLQELFNYCNNQIKVIGNIYEGLKN